MVYIRKLSLAGLPGFPEAFQSKKQHQTGEENSQNQTADPVARDAYELSVFLNSGHDKDNAEGEKDSTQDLKPHLTQCPKEVGEDRFQFVHRDGHKRAG
jgi:hypothetical protein